MSLPKATPSVATFARRDFLGEGLAELKGTIEKSMQSCKSGDEAEIEERHNDEFLEAIQADVSELAQMATEERRNSASHTIDMLNQLRRIVEENHRLVLSLTEETFQNLKEEQRMRHAELLRAIQESRGKQ